MPYMQSLKGLHFGLRVVVSRLTAKGKIISCLSVFQYLNGRRGLQEGTSHLYRFTKINLNGLSENS